MIKFFKELIFLTALVAVTLAGMYFVLAHVKIRAHYETYAGNIEKKELKIFSPVYGKIEKYRKFEGDDVKKGEIIAEVKDIHFDPDAEKKPISYTVKNGVVYITAPQDATLAKRLFAENSDVAMHEPFLILYSAQETYIKVQVPKAVKMSEYKNFFVQGPDGKTPIPIRMLKAAPDESDKNSHIYLAQFQAETSAHDFKNNETIKILGEKQNSDFPLANIDSPQVVADIFSIFRM